MNRNWTIRCFYGVALVLCVLGAVACGTQAKETVDVTYYYLPG